MLTLHQAKFLFNRNIKIANDAGDLSNDAGTLLLAEFMHQINFGRLLTQTVQFKDERKYHHFSKSSLFKQLVFQLAAGYQNDEAANTLCHDTCFNLALNRKVASQPSLSRFINQIRLPDIFALQRFLAALTHFVLHQTNQHQLVVDLDSTHTDTYGQQEDSAFNAHYQANGYHPLLAFEALSGSLLAAKLRPGNEYTSKGAEKFLLRILREYRSDSQDILIRGDSGFAKPGIYRICTKKGLKFTIRLKANHKLQDIAEHLLVVGQKDFDQPEVQWHIIDDYCPKTWDRPYRVIIKSTRLANEYLFQHEFIVTNFAELRAPAVFRIYQHRGVIEDLIKEVKDAFHFDKSDSPSFTANYFRMLAAGIAYQVIQALKNLALPSRLTRARMATLRFKLSHIGAKITKHAHQLQVHLSSTNVFDELYWQVLKRIQNLRLLPT